MYAALIARYFYYRIKSILYICRDRIKTDTASRWRLPRRQIARAAESCTGTGKRETRAGRCAAEFQDADAAFLILSSATVARGQSGEGH